MTSLPQRQNGFSLLEALIAIMILAGVFMALGPAVSAAARAAARIHIHSATEEDIRSARRFFNDIITQSMQSDDQTDESFFVGGVNDISFATLDANTLTPVSIRLEITTGASQNLVAHFEATDEDAGATYTLMNNIHEARFEYLSDANRAAQQWRGQWREKAPPALIRLTGVLRNERQTRNFSFEAAPIADAPVHCQFDPVSRACR